MRTHFIGSACIAAMVIVIVVSTAAASISVAPAIQHAGCAHERVTLVAMLRDVAGARRSALPILFRGGFVEIPERPRWSEVAL